MALAVLDDLSVDAAVAAWTSRPSLTLRALRRECSVHDLDVVTVLRHHACELAASPASSGGRPESVEELIEGAAEVVLDKLAQLRELRLRAGSVEELDVLRRMMFSVLTIRNPKAVFATGTKRERTSTAKRHQLLGVRSVPLDGFADHDRRLEERLPAPAGGAGRGRGCVTSAVLAGTSSCPLCVARGRSCPSGVGVTEMLGVVGGTRSVEEIIDVVKATTLLYSDPACRAEALWQRWSRTAFHLVGVMAHVLVMADDPRAMEPALLLHLRSRFQKARVDSLHHGRETLASERALEVLDWIDAQKSRLQRGWGLDQAAFARLYRP